MSMKMTIMCLTLLYSIVGWDYLNPVSPIAQPEFSSSTLPIFVINTNNQTIPDDPKIDATLQIIYNGDGQVNALQDESMEYEGSIGIELRGNSTQKFPKKPYNFEFRDEGGEDLNMSIFGWPKESDFVLRASYLDHTFIRNPLAMHMSRQTGQWASRCKHVEVVLNGSYQGIYILMEKIKRDKGRVDINKLKEDGIEGEDLTGGYIFEVTGFDNNLGKSRFLKYPKYDDAAPQQIQYIKDYDNSFRSAMQKENFTDKNEGYHAWIEVESFIDELLTQEAVRNSDAYGWSAYFHKDKGGKLKAGPVWDFDQSAGNSSYPDNGIVSGWMFEHQKTGNTPFFWKKLFSDESFSYAARVRWESLRKDEWSSENLIAYIDSIASYLGEAQEREFAQWPVLGEKVWRETNGYKQRDSYQKEVEYLKGFLVDRWAWLDEQFAAISNPDVTTSTNPIDGQLSISIYPNPAHQQIFLQVPRPLQGAVEIQVFNTMGQLVMQHQIDYLPSQPKALNISGLSEGLFTFIVSGGKSKALSGKFVKLK